MHGFFPLFYLAAVQAPATGRLESEKKNFYSSRGERVSVSRFSCAHLSSIRIIARARPAREVTNRPPRAQLPRHAGRQWDRVEHPQLLARHELGSEISLQQRIITSRKGMEGTRGKGKYKAKGATVAGRVTDRRVHTNTRRTYHSADSSRTGRTGTTHTQPSLSHRTPEAAAVVRAPHRLVPRLPPLLLALRFVLPPAS